jgi:hypothetical protein
VKSLADAGDDLDDPRRGIQQRADLHTPVGVEPFRHLILTGLLGYENPGSGIIVECLVCDRTDCRSTAARRVRKGTNAVLPQQDIKPETRSAAARGKDAMRKPWWWPGHGEPVARFTAYLACFTAILVIVAVAQWCTLHGQQIIMQGQLDAMAADQRPWIKIEAMGTSLRAKV